jgi:hypothetical protein
MLKTLMLAAGAALMLAGPVMAQDACSRPTAPGTIDGSTATKDQLLASRAAAQAFIAASDSYQECVLAGVTAQREAAKAAKKKFDEKIAKAAQVTIDANQVDKQATGDNLNTAVRAYKAAHPAPPAS